MGGVSTAGFRGVLLACVVAFGAAEVAAQDATPEQEFAQRHFERGIELFDRGEHEQALASFQASHDLVASPNSLLFVARTLLALGRRVEAAEAYARTTRDARARAAAEPRFAQTAEAADAEQAELIATLARIVVRVRGEPSGLEVRVGDRAVPREALGLPVVIEPGSVEVVGSAAERPTERRRVEAPAGAETVVVLDLSAPAVPPTPPELIAPVVPDDRPAPEDRGGSWSTPLAWTSLAVGAVGWAALASFGALARAKHEDLVERCDGGPCPPELAGQVSRGRLYQTLANVGLVVGAVGTVAGLGLLLFVDPTPAGGNAGAYRLDVALSGVF